MNFVALLASALTLMALPFVAVADANKPVIGVGAIESAFYDYDARNIQTAIETALSKTGKFTLIERSRIDELLAEQNLSLQGLVDGNISGLGGFGGVDYLLYGRFTQLSLEADNKFLYAECDARFGLDIRVVDVASGEIRISDNTTLKDSVNTSDAQDNPCRGIGIAAFDGLTARTARTVAANLTQTLFPVKIAKVDDMSVYLNYGEEFLGRGEFLRIVSLGEGFVDPDTGERLGAEEEVIGFVKVSKTKAKFSIAEIVFQNQDFSVGDVAQRLGKDERKRLENQIRDCDRAQRAEEKACRKSDDRCDKAMDEREEACALP